ncbi:hypothetical protein AAZX31_17G216900 [Glycine max]
MQHFLILHFHILHCSLLYKVLSHFCSFTLASSSACETSSQMERYFFYLNFVGKDFVICVERRGIYYHSISFLIHLNDNRKYYNENYIVGRKCLISIL